MTAHGRRVLAVVPARGGSKGLPGKNIADVGGLPLLAHAILLARAVPEITRCIVSTDDDEIADIAERYGADVPFRRPPELAGDDVPMAPVVRHALAAAEAQDGAYDFVVLLMPTTPVRRASDVSDAIARLDASDADGAVAVSEPPFHPVYVGVRNRADMTLERYFPAAAGMIRRQDTDRFLRITGQFYVWRASFVRRLEHSWLDEGRHLGIVTDDFTAADVDTAADLERVRGLVANHLAELPTGEDGRSARLLRRLIDEWTPVARRAVRRWQRTRARSAHPQTRSGSRPTNTSSSPLTEPAEAPVIISQTAEAVVPEAHPRAPQRTERRWAELTERTLAGLRSCAQQYRPTNFWGPGVDALLRQMNDMGLPAFKRWPAAYFWFYPIYGVDQRTGQAAPLLRVIEKTGAVTDTRRLRNALRELGHAMRDYDAARLAWDHDRWPIDLESFGESQDVGRPPQRYLLSTESKAAFTKPYLNYMLCMAALSRHVTEPPRSFVELGGGFGVLGEFLMARDPDVRYVDLDIPPLLTVASYYLTTLFGDERVATFDESVPDDGPIELSQSGVLPNWRLPDLVGQYDVFVNSFSFQEMEPPVVENYVDIVSRLGVRYVVSLNSRRGKQLATDDAAIGVKEQVVSQTIIDMFVARGYEVCGRYNRPLLAAAGELAILRRR